MSTEKSGTSADNGPGKTWDEESETCWDRRSRLEKKLIFALGFAVCLIVGFAFLFAMRPQLVDSSSDGTCNTPTCLEAASQIIAHIDTRVDPCDDFFKFACNRYIEHTHGDQKVTSVKELKDLVERQIEEIIKEPVRDDDPEPLKRQKLLLQACLNETVSDEESTFILEEQLDELNGWPVVVGYRWREKKFDWINAVVQLKRMGHQYDMLLQFVVDQDPQNEDRHILKIMPPLVSKIKDEHREMYKRLMANVAIAFGAEENRAVVEMEKVLDFQDKLREISDKYDETARKYPVGNETRITVREFQKQVNEIDWLDFINAILHPVANITADDYVLFPPTEFVKDLFRLIYKIHKRTTANYIIWNVVMSSVPFLGKDVRNLAANYSCQVSNGGFQPDRFKFCNNIIKESLMASPADIVYARKYLPQEKRDQVREILDNVKSQFLTIFEENTWMDEASKSKVGDKIGAIKGIVGAPGDYFNDSIFDIFDSLQPDLSHPESKEEDGEEYEEEEDEQEESVRFLPTILKGMSQQVDYMFSRLNVGKENGPDEEIFYYLITTVNALYLLSENSIMIPAGILQGIFYDRDRPMYLNYGSIGSIMGHELTHSVCKDASEFDKNGLAGEMWSEETEKAFDEAARCMVASAENFDVEGTERTINGTQTLEENVADTTGVKVAYAAYNRWVEENGEEEPLPGLEYTPRQLFWISAILHECYALHGERLELGLLSDIHANNAFRAISPMRNNEDFAKDFECAPDSNMNPSEKCQIF